MPITLIYEVPGVTALQYEQVNQILQSSGVALPQEMRAHVACPTDDGWMVVEVFDTPEAAREAQKAIAPVLRQVGIPIDQHPPRMLPVHMAFMSEMRPEPIVT